MLNTPNKSNNLLWCIIPKVLKHTIWDSPNIIPLQSSFGRITALLKIINI